MNHEFKARLEQACVRIEKCIPLFGAFGDERPNDDLAEFLDGVDPEVFERLFPGFEADPSDHESFLYEAVGYARMGFVVQVATPVMRPVTKSAMSYSWGNYYTRWLYAETVDDIVTQAEAWAAERRQAERERFEPTTLLAEEYEQMLMDRDRG